MGSESAFRDLRRLAEWFSQLPTLTQRPAALHIERLVKKLGATCVPLVGRELCAREPRRRDAARAAMAHLASSDITRARVIAELRRIAASEASDEGKVCALGLLAELGERAAARFHDPSAIQRRSAIALAAQLATPADVAAAADLMVHQLSDADMLQLVAVMAEAVPPAAHRLGAELCARLDLDVELREKLGHVLASAAPEPVTAEAARVRAPRPTHVTILVDAAARLVVVAARKIAGERRWRRWAVLIDIHGRIDDCIHEEAADQDDAALIASLCADGYRVASSDVERARGIVAAAARLTGEDPQRLASAYYLGRDLLDLGEAHLGGRVHAHPTSTTLGRAVELIADGEPARAQVLLARCDPASADVAAATAAALLAQDRATDALPHLARAVELEPTFPLHHWNLGATLHRTGDASGAYQALRRFVATSSRPTGLYADPDQGARVGLAQRMLAELERTARLAGTPLRRRKRRATTRRKLTTSSQPA